MIFNKLPSFGNYYRLMIFDLVPSRASHGPTICQASSTETARKLAAGSMPSGSARTRDGGALSRSALKNLDISVLRLYRERLTRNDLETQQNGNSGAYERFLHPRPP